MLQQTLTRNTAQPVHFTSACSVDCVIFGFDEKELKVLLVDCDQPEFAGLRSLPGGIVREDEDLDDAANRVLRELTGLEHIYMEQVQTFGRVDRHPSGRVFTIAYFSLINLKDYHLHAPEGKDALWLSFEDIKVLAFDHNEILDACRQKLRREVRMRPIGFKLLPAKFTLSELQTLYQVMLGVELDKRNFRKKILGMKLLVELPERQANVAHRPAQLYRFDDARYNKLRSEGLLFEI